ncbi:L-lactate permease [Paracidobacterium acidisoli]|uniref:L-lactate permease n=1 Tax=Paracidobacterium acidisoli TaxID=2303751 RepID=A0A372IPL5_9BACT|nr:lactate permease LctP family transporter [Paracidobacterium acidisoli]MBT9332196.1 L-lactate permease [Paracidobacterium acidisoli]
MHWSQTYLLFGKGLAFSAALAATPVLTLLLLLGVFRKAAWIAGLSGLGVTFLLAIGAYHMPTLTAVSAAMDGAAFGLFPISWIVFWAIALFRVTEETGKFEIIKDSVSRLTPDRRLQALLIAFAFGAFIEGAAGFGTPVAIAATMLTGLGFSAFGASALCLLANTAPVAFGSIGIPVVTLAGTTGLPLDKLSAAVGSFCAPVSLILPAYLVIAMWGMRGISGIWLPAGVAGVVFASVQFFVSHHVGPQLTDILASLTAMIALVVLLRVWHPTAEQTAEYAFEKPKATGKIPEHTTLQVMYAWLPYGLLVICVLLWGYKPIQTFLNLGTYSFHWPFLHNVVRRMAPIVNRATPYPAVFNLNWFSASGTSCMTATVLSAICLRMSPRHFFRVLVSVAWTLLLPTVTVTSVLAIAFLMNYCGATATLGLAFSATGVLFPFFGSMLGWLGVFLTGSDTSSNALFGNLQVITAGRLGLDPILLAATNSAGGVMGKMISLQTIAVAAAATGLSVSDQAKLFRFTLKHSILLASVIGALALLYVYAFHFHWA